MIVLADKPPPAVSNKRNMETGPYHIRWRSQEFLLVTIAILAFIGGDIRPIFQESSQHLIEWHGQRFADLHLSFNYYGNVLFPRVLFLIVVYACYNWIYWYVIPCFMGGIPAPKPGPGFRLVMHPGRIIWCIFNILLVITVLGIAWAISFSYLEAPTVAEDQLSPAMIVGSGLRNASGWAIGYLIYAAIREIATRRLETDTLRNGQWIALVNQLSGFMLIYYAVGLVLVNFAFIDIDAMKVFYFVILPPAVLTVYTNLYWVFPVKPEGKLWRGWKGRAGRRLLISSGAWPLPFLIFSIGEGKEVMPAWIAFWMVQLLATTAISWVIWRQRKDKLLQVQGLQTALGQSEADLQFLRSQINPHFLFNVLNTLYGTALQEDANRTAEGVQKLGDMMRFMLHDNHLAEIPMNKEVEYLKNYIALQELRTESAESIRIETDIDDLFPDYHIAPMLLIPFVENGFKHGISLREPSWIKLQLHNEGNRILFEMRNSVHIRKNDDPERSRSGIGLKNVLHRLKLLYPNRHEFYMHQDEKEFFVQLSIQP